MPCFTERPLRAKINAAYSLDGISMARPVGITAVSPHERVSGSFKRAHKSRPALPEVALSGTLASGSSFLIFKVSINKFLSEKNKG